MLPAGADAVVMVEHTRRVAADDALVEVTKPAYPCANCHGRGKQRHTRLTCSACKGTGHITVAGPTARCPECAGIV